MDTMKEKRFWKIIACVTSFLTCTLLVWDIVRPPIKVVVDWGERLNNVEQAMVDSIKDRQGIHTYIAQVQEDNTKDHAYIIGELDEVKKISNRTDGKVDALLKYVTGQTSFVSPEDVNIGVQ